MISGWIEGTLQAPGLGGHSVSTKSMAGSDVIYVNRLELQPGVWKLQLHGAGSEDARKLFKCVMVAGTMWCDFAGRLHVVVGKGMFSLHNGDSVCGSFDEVTGEYNHNVTLALALTASLALALTLIVLSVTNRVRSGLE